MKAKVTAIFSGAQFADGVERVALQFTDAEALFNDIRIRNTDGYRLDEELEVTISRAPTSAAMETFRKAYR